MKYWIAGLFGVVMGIALLSVNFWLGVVVIGSSTLTARLFQGRATRQAMALVAKKGKWRQLSSRPPRRTHHKRIKLHHPIRIRSLPPCKGQSKSNEKLTH
jgi:hypothetical protein